MYLLINLAYFVNVLKYFTVCSLIRLATFMQWLFTFIELLTVLFAHKYSALFYSLNLTLIIYYSLSRFYYPYTWRFINAYIIIIVRFSSSGQLCHMFQLYIALNVRWLI